jgi:hypothetical protein
MIETDRWMMVGKADISTTVKRLEDHDDESLFRYDMTEFQEWLELDKL